MEYSFKGTLDVDGFFAKDLKGKAEVKVMHAAMNTFPPGTMTTRQTVITCLAPPAPSERRQTGTNSLLSGGAQIGPAAEVQQL